MTEDRPENPCKDLDQMTPAEKYRVIVIREFPFLPLDTLVAMEETEVPELLRYCLDLAAQLSFQNGCVGLSESQAQKLSSLINQQDLDLIQAAGLMLLLPRVDLASTLVEKVSLHILDILRHGDTRAACGKLTFSKIGFHALQCPRGHPQHSVALRPRSLDRADLALPRRSRSTVDCSSHFASIHAA